MENREKLSERELRQEDEIDLYELWLILKKRKKLILGIFLTATVLTAIVSFLMTPIYRSEATVIPVSSKSSGLGNLAELAAIAGVPNPSAGDESSKIIAVLNSREIKERVIKKLNLIPILLEGKQPKKRDPMNVAVEILEKMVSISDDKKTGVIKISVEHKDPKLAQKIAQAYIEELQEMMNEKKLTVAKFNRMFLEEQLKEQEKRLRELQERLIAFQKKTKIIAPESQLSGVLGLYANLVSQRMSLIAKLKSMEATLAPDHPQIKALREQLAAIDSQIRQIEERSNIGALPSLSTGPERLTEYGDLMRELKVAQKVYENLLAMYEQVKIDEAKENIYVEVIDRPNLPDVPVKPKKKLMVAVAGTSALFFGVFLAFFLEWLDSVKRRNQENIVS